MKIRLLSVTFSLLVISTFGQNKEDYKREMIESGEAQHKEEVPEQFASSVTDLATFKRTKAWNSRPTANSIFSNTKDLDISKIGGRVRSSLVDKDNNIALVAPSGGGLWSFNPTDGSSFSPIDDFGSFMAVTHITQNPNYKQEIIIGTGDELHGVTGKGLFKSTNGGQSFLPMIGTDPTVITDFNYIRFVKYSPQTANTIYIATGNKLYKSTDSGVSWSLVFEASKNDDIRSLDFLAGTGVILAVEDQGLFSSTTGNASTFSLLTSTIPNDIDAINGTLDGIVLATHAANRNIAYALFTGTDGNHMYKTTTGGTSWTKLTDPTYYISQTWFCLALGVHPTDPNIVIGGSVGWGYTKDGGTTWVKAGGLEVDYHDVHFHASNPDVAYIGYDQGIGRVDFANESEVWAHNGTTWVRVQQATQLELGKKPGFNTSQIYYGDYFPEAYGDSYIMGQQDGGSFAKVAGQERRILVGDGGSMFVNKQTPTKAFGSTQKGNLKVTTNAIDPNSQSGAYTNIDGFYDNHPNWITQFAGNNADGEQMYISKTTTIERTKDGGATFTSIANHALEDVKIAVEEAINPVVYAMGYDKANSWHTSIIRIENATNANPTKTTFPSKLDYWADRKPEQITVNPNNKNTIYVTSTNGNAYKMTDMNTATPVVSSIKGNIPDVKFNVIIGVKGSSDVLIAGTNTGLFYSEDAGTTWSLYNEIPYTQVSDLKLRDSDKRLFVFTYGRGAWATSLNLNPLAISITNTQTISVKSFPNPTNEFVTISTEQKNDVIIFDAKGNKVVTGITNEKLNVSTLPSGIYISHVLNNGELIATEKIIIE